MSRDNKRHGRSIDRRTALKAFSGIAGLGGFTALSYPVAATHPPECGLDHEEDTNSTYDYDDKGREVVLHEYSDDQRGMEVTSSPISVNSWYADGKWWHRQVVSGFQQLKYKETNDTWDDSTWLAGIKYHEIHAANDNTSKSSMWVSSASNKHGGAPGGSDYYFAKAGMTAVKSLLGGSTPLGYALVAAEAFESLNDGGWPSADEEVTHRYEYGWDDWPCQAVNFIELLFENKDGNDSISYKSRSDAVDYDGFGTRVSWNIDVSADTGASFSSETLPSSSSTTTTMSRPSERPEPGTPEYEEWLANNDNYAKIPYEELDEDTQQHVPNGEPVYKALNPTVKMTATTETIEP